MPPKKTPHEGKLQEIGFTEKIVSLLKDMDFNTTESLYLLAGPSGRAHIEAIGLTLAQKLLLLEFVNKDSATKDSPANKKDGMPQSVSLDTVLDRLQLSGADGERRTTDDAEQQRFYKFSATS